MRIESKEKQIGFRRVCLFAGPGAGKSTLALRIASVLKTRGVHSELVLEWVKGWAYQNIPIQGFDQVYIFARQIRQEEIVLRSSPSIVVVSDCPPLMIVSYARRNVPEIWRPLRDIAMAFEQQYPALNFFVDRKELSYRRDGRYEDAEGAMDMDNRIKSMLDSHGTPFDLVGFDDEEQVIGKIMEHM